ncbi:hypothetical protein QQS21_004452 [Conoideocrella luteorostrata]|uniref:Oxidoreductase-like domain-containing protein n=1 Tax=Conoideocrella luteorostrata TaxID=1105319 RepID=A0AAJ0FZV7_9HYPO|nr:hypothetical protein QQS21_004452 [Conoideocrella luteorostrata]
MSAPTRLATTQLRLLPRLSVSTRTFTSSPTFSKEDDQWPQKMPLGDYYTSILRDPIPYPFTHKPEEPPSTADPSVQPAHRKRKSTPAEDEKKASKNTDSGPATTAAFPSAAEPTPQEKARIIFGSRLLGSAEVADRVATKQAKSTYMAGVLVPPQPEEPDNCCMSGCVNCVWDQYREDMEEWTAKKKEAQSRLKAGPGTMDTDGGGSETNWKAPVGSTNKIAKDMWDDDVYQGVPVGIREFMKQEKRLKEKHAREGTVGG